MKVAAAQTIPKNTGPENMADHLRLASLAANQGAHLVVFPEMSLTGYQRENAASAAFTPTDKRLEPLITLASSNNITLVAGAPVKTHNGLHIGAFIIQPSQPVALYTKQFLHAGEELFFTPSFHHNPLIELQGERISFAICADIAHTAHAENAAKNNTNLYVAGIFYTPGGIEQGYKDLSAHAKKHNMHVLMANYAGPSYNMAAAGKSAFWQSNGLLSGQLQQNEGVLIVDITLKYQAL